MADDAVLSDVDDDEDPTPLVLSPSPSSPDRLRTLLAELDDERRARKSAEDAKSDLQAALSRLKAFAQDVIKKRDEATRERDDAARSAHRAAADLSDALRLSEESSKQRDALQSEIDAASQMLATGIDNVSKKIASFKNFPPGNLPKSQRYPSGLPAVAYGAVKRANEIAEELVRHIESATQSRDQAREQMEQRNYEIAIEVSQLEATIGGLRDDVQKKDSDIASLEKSLADRDAKISTMEEELSELRRSGEDCGSKLRSLEAKLDSYRPLVIDQLNYTSKAYEKIREVIRAADAGNSDQSDSSFMWEEMDLDKNLHTSLEGIISVHELARVAAEKMTEVVEERARESKALNDRVSELLMEKQHIGTLLRGALSSKVDEVLQVAENGLREAGIDLRFAGHDKDGAPEGEEDEVYTLAGALENTVKASQLEIIELQHLVETLRAESGLLKARLGAQAKEISQQTNLIKELEEKERAANESVEGLMMDIAAAEEEIVRWKAAAEQEAAAGRAVEQEFLSQLSAIGRELDEAKQSTGELEGKVKLKEGTAAAAMAARDAAESSLRLADMRATRLRERVEELTRQLDESDARDRSSSRGVHNANHRYMCWPWEWLGLNSFIRHNQQAIQEGANPNPNSNPNEMELSEPLI